MTKFRKNLGFASAVILMAGALSLSSCGLSAEQLKQLDDLKKEVASLESDVTSLKSEKSKLEREIAEHNAKLEQCEKDKAATKKNLENIK